ncbi:Hypothetical protein A7982_06682 [Minicystis rosea]|nr:Hypothetical protein A7982_06682 [Minicystis rosea]
MRTPRKTCTRTSTHKHGASSFGLGTIQRDVARADRQKTSRLFPEMSL